MADVFALDDDSVVKLDKPEFRGVAAIEAEFLGQLEASGLPVPRVGELVEIDGRTGFAMERLRGPLLTQLIVAGDDVDRLVHTFVDTQLDINRLSATGLPELRPRLASEIACAHLAPTVAAELSRAVEQMASPVGVCHFDFHPDNVIVTRSGWRVIDWIGAAHGPTHADFARSLVLRANSGSPELRAFVRSVGVLGRAARAVTDDELDGWTRVVAGARLAEGFDGADAGWLTRVAHDGLAAAVVPEPGR
jgi:aminoglycoside phosphotransferase (APT) family kinase protein